MDGTTVDTSLIWKTATKMFLKENLILNQDIASKIHEQTKGIASIEIGKIIKKETNLKYKPSEIINRINKIAENLDCNNVSYIRGFETFHRKLKEKNIIIAMVTNASEVFIEKINKKLNMKKYFENHIYNSSHVNWKYKPLPDVYLYAAKAMRVDPKNCIAIEDSICGVAAAKKANMYCILINTSKISDLSRADIIVNSYDKIKLDKLI
jgi:HAD superfamily hydrolase (TIGR01509 family)